MHIVKSFVIAFSVYSRIPVPQFKWKEEDMKYMLCFFPWIGAVIGVCVYGWHYLCGKYFIGGICRAMIGAVIPLVITGGFHVDGFMDTMDAFHSYAPKEKKLEILKDSHIGAFAVIELAVYGLFYVGAFSEVTDDRLLQVVCSGFFLSRCLSGISAVSFPLAKKEGMLFEVADRARKTIVKWVLILQSILCLMFMFWITPMAWGAAAAALLTFIYYFFCTKKKLGGITGDTAGFFVLISEGSMAGAMAAINILGF